jgi:bifunctional non-homologous end joining protein LigD
VHKATGRRQYDLRLELEGVLKSWAITNRPSLAAGEKRLAVEVEDQPLDDRRFEGNIPKGQDGAGSVIVWDHGSWQPDGDPRVDLSKGELQFYLFGAKLQGGWHLIRVRPKKRGKPPQLAAG